MQHKGESPSRCIRTHSDGAASNALQDELIKRPPYATFLRSTHQGQCPHRYQFEQQPQASPRDERSSSHASSHELRRSAGLDAGRQRLHRHRVLAADAPSSRCSYPDGSTAPSGSRFAPWGVGRQADAILLGEIKERSTERVRVVQPGVALLELGKARKPGPSAFRSLVSPRNLKYARLHLARAQNRARGACTNHLVPQHRLLEKVDDERVRSGTPPRHEAGWSRNVLAVQIENRQHERQGNAVTNFPRTLPPSDSDLATQAFKDPYRSTSSAPPSRARNGSSSRVSWTTSSASCWR